MVLSCLMSEMDVLKRYLDAKYRALLVPARVAFCIPVTFHCYVSCIVGVPVI